MFIRLIMHATAKQHTIIEWIITNDRRYNNRNATQQILNKKKRGREDETPLIYFTLEKWKPYLRFFWNARKVYGIVQSEARAYLVWNKCLAAFTIKVDFSESCWAGVYMWFEISDTRRRNCMRVVDTSALHTDRRILWQKRVECLHWPP